MVESDLVGPQFSLDVLLDFVSYFDNVPSFFFLHMDLSFFFFLVLVWLS